jgi:hypothetical protein
MAGSEKHPMPPVTVTPAETKRLETCGHHVSLWAAAAQRLLARLHAGRLRAELSDWLLVWQPESHPTPMQEGDELSIVFSEVEDRWLVQESSLPWLGDPFWHAWLHLPALRSGWSAELRASHLQSLRAMIPPAWCMDPTPLPPGTVIAGLGIASWQKLTALRQKGMAFAILFPGEKSAVQELHPDQPMEAWQDAIEAALQHPRTILMPGWPSPKRRLGASFSSQAGRIQMTSLRELI